MFKSILFAAVIPTLSVLADIGPLEPAPGNVYNQGAKCNINWSTDPTGQWTTMNIELMTGSNEEMVHLTTVATLDGTKDTSYSWTCPTVSPNSAIYFYQFSSPAASGNLSWTGRFAIADANGKTTDPTDEADGVKFGTGALSDPSTASAAPSYLGGGAVASTAAGPSASSGGSQAVSSATSATGALTATGSLTTSRATARTSDAVNQASASDSAASSTSTASGAIGLAVDFKARALQALAGLIGTAFIFSTVF